MEAVRRTLIIFGALVSILFASLFATSFWSDKIINATAKAVIKHKIVSITGEPPERLTNSTLVEKAKQVLAHNEKSIAIIKSLAAGKFRALIDEQIDRLSDSHCECRSGGTEILNSALSAVATELERQQLVLKEAIRTKYLEYEAAFVREFRIFTGTNLAAGLLVLLAALIKRRAGIHLIPPAALLLAALAIAAYSYLFSQNWLHAILFQDYVGFAYAGYLSALFLCLCDVLLNYARVTTNILNFLSNLIGGTLSLTPC